MDSTTANAIANEARRQQVKLSITDLKARADNASSLIGIINSTLNDANIALAAKQQELAAIEAGAGPGVTDDWGSRVDFVSAFVQQLATLNLITAAQQATFLTVSDGTYQAPAQ